METRKYFGCLVQQREDNDTTQFFVFVARVKDVKQWAGIQRIQEFSEGTQRILRKTRVRHITRFLASSSINTIPSNILMAFSPGSTNFTSLSHQLNQLEAGIDYSNQCDGLLKWGVLEFTFDSSSPEHLRPALIVDGQHRLYGMSSFEQENLPVIIVSLVDATSQEQAFQFIVVNSKAVRVNATTAKSIIADVEEQALEDRLLGAGIQYGEILPTLRDINDLPSSPFYMLLKWERNRTETQVVPLTAIEQSLRFLRTTFSNFLEDDEDSLVEIFMAIWRVVQRRYPEIWGHEESNLMKKVSINAFNEFIALQLKSASNFGLVEIFDVGSVESWLTKFLEPVVQEFWDSEWSIKIQDNANVREQIKEDLGTITDNYKLRKHWSESLNLPLPLLVHRES